MLSSSLNPFAKRAAKAAPAKGAPKPKGSSRKQFLQLLPLRNPALGWDEENGIVVLRIRHQQSANAGNWKARVAKVFVQLPEERAVELDAVGSDVWQMMDGQTRVSAIVDALIKKHRLTRREAELSVQQYFKELSRRNYIGFLAEVKQVAPTAEAEAAEAEAEAGDAAGTDATDAEAAEEADAAQAGEVDDKQP